MVAAGGCVASIRESATEGLPRVRLRSPGRTSPDGLWAVCNDGSPAVDRNPSVSKRVMKNAAKLVARQTVGRLPAPASRLNGRLAIDGGTPVRDIRLRPWANYHSGNLLPWFTTVGPAFRKIFLSGIEGLPQARQKQFAEQWAKYCGCRHALLLPHGTDALRLALAAVLDHDGLDYGGEVIVPNF